MRLLVALLALPMLSVRKVTEMDPQIIMFLYICVALIFLFGIFLFSQRSNQKKDKAAYVEGYVHALTVHNLDANSVDEITINNFKSGSRNGLARTWEMGYRTALSNHKLAWTERDSREIWHNPYVAIDHDNTVGAAAGVTAMSIQNAAHTLRR